MTTPDELGARVVPFSDVLVYQDRINRLWDRAERAEAENERLWKLLAEATAVDGAELAATRHALQFTPEQMTRAHELAKERRAERVRLWLQVSEAPEDIVAAFEKLARAAAAE